LCASGRVLVESRRNAPGALGAFPLRGLGFRSWLTQAERRPSAGATSIAMRGASAGVSIEN